MISTANVTTTASNIYISSGSTVMSLAYLCNYSASPTVVNVYAVPSGTTSSNLNLIYCNVTIQSHDTLVIETEKFVFGSGDALQANASANNAIAFTISYTSI